MNTSSVKPLRVYSGNVTVGIYPDQAWSIRLYEGKAIVRMPYVKWSNDTGTLDVLKERIEPGYRLTKLLEAYRAEHKDNVQVDEFGDDVDYNEIALGIVTP